MIIAEYLRRGRDRSGVAFIDLPVLVHAMRREWSRLSAADQDWPDTARKLPSGCAPPADVR